MAEYMDYNDYDYDFKNKRQKIFANIRLVISIAFLAAVVIWTFTHLPENVRTSFSPVYSSAHNINESIVNKDKTNEFVEFNQSYENDEKVNFDDDFKKHYPQIYNIAKMGKNEIAKKKVVSFDQNGYFVIATTYEVNREKNLNGDYYDDGKKYIVGITGVDFYIFQYDTNKNFTINKPIRFSIRLHAGNNDLIPYVEKTYVKSDSFRLNFYSLSIIAESKNKFSEISSVINLEEGINKKQADNNFFTEQSFVKSSEGQNIVKTSTTVNGGKRGDKFVENKFNLQGTVNKAEIGINFDDAVYNKFKSIVIVASENTQYTIKVN